MRESLTIPWSVRLSAPQRLGIVVAFSVVIFAVQPSTVAASSRLLLTWDSGALAYLALAWMTIARADSTMCHLRALSYDQSGYVIFLLVVTAACASIVAIGFVVGELKQLPPWSKAFHLSLSVAALFLSWTLIHTLFAFHYAREYYGRPEGAEETLGGLKFPSLEEPDYFDFAYYSFVVGMTSQVSDVAVTASHMRRTTLSHAVLSFTFNIAVLAMSINVISGVL